jgi:hypothetical protein
MIETSHAEQVERLNSRVMELLRERDALVKALQKIADLVDSEAGEPLDDAIKIANDAIELVGCPKP